MKGNDAISADYKNIAADPAATFTATTDSVKMSADSDLAFAEGSYRVRYTNQTTKVVEHAKDYYLLVYGKQPDGSWKIIRDISSPQPEG
jgi:ketosteroid isomerase-like protein